MTIDSIEVERDNLKVKFTNSTVIELSRMAEPVPPVYRVAAKVVHLGSSGKNTNITYSSTMGFLLESLDNSIKNSYGVLELKEDWEYISACYSSLRHKPMGRIFMKPNK